MGSRVEAKVQFDTGHLIASVTRPADVNAYGAGDVVGEAFVFEDFSGVARRSGLISSARITSSANQGTKLHAELWLFPEEPASLAADNAPWAPTDAELASRVGVIEFPESEWNVGNPAAGAAGNAGCDVQNLGIIYKERSTTFYGVVVARNAYTPVSEEVITIDLMVSRD